MELLHARDDRSQAGFSLMLSRFQGSSALHIGWMTDLMTRTLWCYFIIIIKRKVRK